MKKAILTDMKLATVVVVICLAVLLGTAGSVIAGAGADRESQGQQAVEKHYQNQIDELRMRENAEAREVNEAQRAQEEKAEAVKREQYIDDLHYVPSANVLSKEELAAFEKQRAEKNEAVRARTEQRVKAVEEEKARALEISTAGAARTAQPGPRTQAVPLRTGTVTGIVFYDDKGAALVCGEIVREGDVVRDVKVVTVKPGFVEFEKQGKKWKQEVGQAPPVADWEPPASPATQPAAPSSASPSAARSSPAPKQKPAGGK